MTFIEAFKRVLPYATASLGAFAATYILTPLVREFNRRLGMVDKPGERRVNKVAIPRGGGLALAVGTVGSFAIWAYATGSSFLSHTWLGSTMFPRLATLSLAMAAVGYTDDKFDMNAKLKLFLQLAIGFLAWWWAGLGFKSLWPAINPVLDAALTIFWIAGAVNAFNLIDGLDGLASGLAFIATIGMAGALFMIQAPSSAIYHVAFAGGLIAFLRYNYHPASVFLGDCGSMFIGFTLSVLPLATQTPNSFLVSVVVPLLAMGVPIFDTSLAIIRRSIRSLIKKRDKTANLNGNVMTADSDHVHHRILRDTSLNQRKAAWIMYIAGLMLVAIGLVGMALKSRAAGLWLFGFCAVSVVIFKDMARIELFDAGRLLNSVARDRTKIHRRKIARLATPCYVAFDVIALAAVFLLCCWALRIDIDKTELRVSLPIRVTSVFLFLCIMRSYRTIWARAMSSNYLRLLVACLFGSIAGSIAIYYAPGADKFQLKAMTLAYAATSSIAIVCARLFRGLARDLFYAIDCSRLKARKDVSRILVYGSGLRYRAFRRELVRTTSANDRMIVGLLDDDILLRGQYIGGIKVMGTLAQAPEIINEVNADAVVVACEVRDEWMDIIKKTLLPTGVKITHFTFNEKEISK